ncbi:DoxX family protein [Chitinophaga sp. Cy-1792]|uniref:DoxX family protein n=1 Tax=Chitinophaga sp. Cy-1792 TaxID=2608339 RepID=UPI001420CFCB|nr:DoxX family protein [Chitinophaga sp. Cy-1792]NIG53751.1 DoxX family protein [Chitinophaga sp. Cy-1792]
MRKLFSASFTNGAVDFSMLILRVVFGGLILLHGWPLLINFAAKKNSFPDPLHIGHTTWLSLTIFAEVACAAFVIIGLLTRLAAVPLIICMAVTIFVVHAHEPLLRNEQSVMFLAAFTVTLFTGPGRVSLDNLIA